MHALLFTLMLAHRYREAEDNLHQGVMHEPLADELQGKLLGLIGFVVVGLLLLGYALMLAMRGDAQGMARAIGTRSAEEEVEDEIRDLKQREGS